MWCNKMHHKEINTQSALYYIYNETDMFETCLPATRLLIWAVRGRGWSSVLLFLPFSSCCRLAPQLHHNENEIPAPERKKAKSVTWSANRGLIHDVNSLNSCFLSRPFSLLIRDPGHHHRVTHRPLTRYKYQLYPHQHTTASNINQNTNYIDGSSNRKPQFSHFQPSALKQSANFRRD